MSWALFTRKERWGLTWRGWLCVLFLVGALGLACVWSIYPFLAVTHRAQATALVVEGWVHPYAIRAASREFKTGAYQQVFSTGGPIVGSGGYINDFNTAASVGAELLLSAGIPKESLQMVPCRAMGRDRTYSSALALRDWLREHRVTFQRINIVTEDLHARRTRLLFDKAFSGKVELGIIAVPNPDYDAKHWWRYSEGVRDLLSEAIAYLYARLFFHPGAGGA